VLFKGPGEFRKAEKNLKKAKMAAAILKSFFSKKSFQVLHHLSVHISFSFLEFPQQNLSSRPNIRSLESTKKKVSKISSQRSILKNSVSYDLDLDPAAFPSGVITSSYLFAGCTKSSA